MLTVIVLLIAIPLNSIQFSSSSMAFSATSSGSGLEQTGDPVAPSAGEQAMAPPALQTLIFEAEADSYVTNSLSTQDSNFGAATSFDVDNSPESHGLVRFTVQGGTGAVLHATLSLYVRDGSGAAPLVSLADNSWNESSVTWNNRPQEISAAITSQAELETGRTVDFDVTRLVGANGTFTFNLVAAAPNRVTFTSRESAARSQQPELIVQFDPSVPAPTASAPAVPGNTELSSSPELASPTVTATSPKDALEFDAEADTYIANTASGAQENFGSSTSIAVDREPEVDGLLRFHIAGVKGGVTQATLRLYCRDASDKAPIVVAGSNDWDESELTWETWPEPDASATGESGPIAKNEFVDFDVTTLVGGNGDVTLRLVAVSSDRAGFTSRESSAKAQRPKLIVAFSPSEPTATVSPAPSPTVAPTRDPADSPGYRDYEYGHGTFAPTAKEGQSKVWYAGGQWWGALYYPATGDYFISSLDKDTQTWTRTSIKIDSRNNAKIDTLWDEKTEKLYTVSTLAKGDAAIVVRRFSFKKGKYTADKDFTTEPLAKTGAVDGVVTIAKDSNGVFWVSFVPFAGEKLVYVSHSGDSPDDKWVRPFVISDPATPLREEEITGVVAFGGQIGVMWSDQNVGTMRFARHVDGTADGDWIQEVAFSAPLGADNHIDMKSDTEGRVYAAVKTSMHQPGQPLLVLLIRYPDGTWASTPFSTVADNQTRPMVVIDESNGTLVFFAADSELNQGTSGGRIYYKRVPLDNIVFPPGKGEVAISGGADPALNNVSSTKQMITEGMGILVIAGDDQTRTYWHAVLP